MQKERKEKGRKGGDIDIQFSPNGRFFSVCVQVGGGVEIWDYQTGKLLDYYGIGENIEEVAWLSESKFLIINEVIEFDKGVGKLKNKEIFINEIMLDGTIKRSKQEQLAEQMKNLGILDGYICGIRKGKEIVVVKGENGTFGRHITWANLLDVETGQVKFSLRLYNLVSILFDGKTDTLIVVEHLKSGKRKITLWSIEPKEKKKVMYADVEKWGENQLPNGADLVSQGKKLVFIKGNKIQFVNL